MIVEAVGMVSTALVAAAIAVGAVVGVRSAPDIRRYLKIRKM